MFGLFSMFGRGRELERVDYALRAAGLHPRLVPEAVKLTMLKLLKAQAGGASPDEAACLRASRLLAYCILGREDFIAATGAPAAGDIETRIENALARGDDLDAQLILLALHAGVLQPRVIEAFGLDTD